MQNLPLLIYDGECGFCIYWVDYWKSVTGDAVTYAPYQEVANQFPHISREEFARSIKLVEPDGKVLGGAHAVFRTLSYGESRWVLWFYEHVGPFAFLSEMFYRLVSANRDILFPLVRILWGNRLEKANYNLVSWLFLRILGLIYLLAFFSFWQQIAGLIGSRGIVPVASYLPALYERLGPQAYLLVPSLFWLNTSDAFLHIVSILGLLFSLILILGIPKILERPALVFLYILYLSLVSVGNVFMHFQWDIFLLEVGFLAIFLGRSQITVFLYRFLLFRFVLLSGIVKLASGDLTWRGLTALNYHFETQPLSHVLSWYAHQAPEWLKKFSVGGMFFIELVVPILIFAPRNLRLFAAFSIVLLELFILLTGNYNFFNILTISLCIFLLDDRIAGLFLPMDIRKLVPKLGTTSPLTATARYLSISLTLFLVVMGSMYIVAAITRTIPKPFDYVLSVVAPIRIVNSYGVFAVMTTTRNEIVIEGSDDEETWHEYEFKYKPGNVARVPAWVQPHQPRLDWQMWFAALSNYQNNPWFVNFVTRLLQGSPEVLSLLEKNPFLDKPPRYIRAQFYEYHFTNLKEINETGAWWKRELKGMYLPSVSFKNKQ